MRKIKIHSIVTINGEAHKVLSKVNAYRYRVISISSADHAIKIVDVSEIDR